MTTETEIQGLVGASPDEHAAAAVGKAAGKQMDLTNLPPYLDQRGCCQVLQISRHTFFELVRSGSLPGAFRLGPKLIRVRTDVLLASLGASDDEAACGSWRGEQAAYAMKGVQR